MKYSVIHLQETASTNLFLRELQQKERQPEYCVVVTDAQTAGKGQRGNSWESENGKNLTFSMLLYPSHIMAATSFILSQAVSLAVIEMFETVAPEFYIKWPNDIYWKEKKIGGILIENDLCGKFLDTSIVGIGLNINQQKFVSDAPNPVSLIHIAGREFSLSEWLDKVCKRIIFRYEQTKMETGRQEIERCYMDRLFRKKGFFPFKDERGVFDARIKSVRLSGHLVLERTDGTENTYAFKEVEFLF
ncbi:MAG: biotin--[Bacteroidaceae bacterium]|nr:biotin--[acetyl-CoA-carboxylase] ligase [Bacteroidaceae bacterium]